ncbi:trigger factor [Collinsella sp. AGMB00827]|uniref:Trigger factor n=1 Tax=Collinsella ureilytica TaxID=2869515 RepID=A0ABS7MKM6_9ACTN|nr:trigger factor [Collinsella urealyticum]MBY4797926.1 trigger factor [Collinsella urealyticum]
MNISASDVLDAKLTATVTIPAAEVDAVITSAYRDAAKQYRFPGFRPGKAPRPVIDNMLGKEAVLAQATNELLGASEPKVLNELDIVPVKNGEYQDIEPVVDHEDYTYAVEFTLRPAPSLSSYEPVAISMPPQEVTEAEIDAQVDMLMGYHSTFEDVERPAQAGDYISANVVNIEHAEPLAGENRMFIVGGDGMPTQLSEALSGMKTQETKHISWTPEDAESDDGAPELVIELTVNSIRERRVPELTDEFAKENFGFDSIAAMRDAVKLELEADKTSTLPQLKENRVVSALAERLELDEMDPDYEQSVFQELGQNFLQSLSAQGLTLDAWLQANGLSSDQFIHDLHHQADDVARESLALDALARERAIEVTDEDVDAEFSRAGVEDIEASRAQFTAEGRIPAIRDSIRRSKAVDWLVETAVVTEVDEFAKSDEGSEEEQTSE